MFWGLDRSDPRVRQRIESIVGHVESLQVRPAAPGRSGAQLFRIYCAACHGLDAHGGGPPAAFGTLRRTSPATRNGTAAYSRASASTASSTAGM